MSAPRMARCECCRRTLPRVDCPAGTCHTCAVRCSWGRPCEVRAALELPARKPARRSI